MKRKNPNLSIRIDLAGGRFGPGKADLLEAIAEAGSISAAARQLGMSYARAWKLAEDMNHCFRERLIEAHTGGSDRGGAELTKTGRQVLQLYRQITEQARQATADSLKQIARYSAGLTSNP